MIIIIIIIIIVIIVVIIIIIKGHVVIELNSPMIHLIAEFFLNFSCILMFFPPSQLNRILRPLKVTR